MTPAPQQKEYIIASATLGKIFDIIDKHVHTEDRFEAYEHYKTVLFRPYDPAAIQKERERVLDELKKWTRRNSETIEADDGTLEDAVFLGELLSKIEGLRQQPQEHP